MNHDYPVNQHIQQLLDAANQSRAKNQPEPEPPAPKPWVWSPIAGMTAPVLAVTTSSYPEGKID